MVRAGDRAVFVSNALASYIGEDGYYNCCAGQSARVVAVNTAIGTCDVEFVANGGRDVIVRVRSDLLLLKERW